MNKKFIVIKGINDAANFISKASQVDGEVLCYQGRYIVDGKSIMGLMSIDTSRGFDVEYPKTAVEFENFISLFEER